MPCAACSHLTRAIPTAKTATNTSFRNMSCASSGSFGPFRKSSGTNRNNVIALDRISMACCPARGACSILRPSTESMSLELCFHQGRTNSYNCLPSIPSSFLTRSDSERHSYKPLCWAQDGSSHISHRFNIWHHPSKTTAW